MHHGVVHDSVLRRVNFLALQVSAVEVSKWFRACDVPFLNLLRNAVDQGSNEALRRLRRHPAFKLMRCFRDEVGSPLILLAAPCGSAFV